MVATYKTDYTYVPPTAGSSAQQQAKSGKQQSKSGKHQSKAKHHQAKPPIPPSVAKTTLEEQVELLLKEVSSIKDMIQAVQASYKASNFGADILQPNLFSQEFKPDPRNLFGRYGIPVDTKA